MVLCNCPKISLCNNCCVFNWGKSNGQNQQNNQQGCLTTIKNIVAIIASIVAITVAIILAVHYLKTGQPNPTQILGLVKLDCIIFPDGCEVVPQFLIPYLLGYKPNDIQATQALLQISRALALVQKIQKSYTFDQISYIYKRVMSSLICASYYLPNNFEEAYSDIFQSQMILKKDLQNYLNMSQIFSGQVIKIPFSEDQLASSCLFKSNQTRLLQVFNKTQNCTGSPQSLLIYFDDLGQGPISAVNKMKKINNIILANSLAQFDQILTLGVGRKFGKTDFWQKLILGHIQYSRQNNEQILDNLTLLNMTKNHINLERKISYIHPNLTVDKFKGFLKYVLRKKISTLMTQEVTFDLLNQKQFISRQIKSGKKVVIVAHSFVTLYINKIYNLLSDTEKKSVRLVYIAPVVGSLADGSTNYITNPNDKILEAMLTESFSNTSFPKPLPANQNTTSFISQSDLNLNHELVGYLQAYKQKFVQMLINAKSTAIKPDKVWGKGLFTVTASWEIGSDIDLHIYEPGGAHVFHDSTEGKSGMLDHDNIYGYGPQHYSSTNTPDVGNYQIKVNYYRGVGPQLVKLTIETPRQCVKKQMNLTSFLGMSGDSNPPYYFGGVQVIKFNATQTYDVSFFDL